METLEIIIGLVFIFLLLSLLATTVQEIIAALLSMRGKVLLEAIAKLLEIEKVEEFSQKARKELLEDFKRRVQNSNIYNKYSSYFLWFKRLPSYLSAEQVSDIVREVLLDKEKEDLEKAEQEIPVSADRTVRSRSAGGATTPIEPSLVDRMKPSPLKNSLNVLVYDMPDITIDEEFQQTRGIGTRSRGVLEAAQNFEEEIRKAKDEFKRYYDETMDRATGWYKRNVQRNLFIIGLILGAAFDADTFKIYSNLTNFPDDRQQLLELAVGFTDDRFAQLTPDTVQGTATMEEVSELKELVETLLKEEIEQVPAPLGLGRPEGFWVQPPETTQNPIRWRVIKFIGWLVTALAVSMGAAFWFDILKRLIHIRNAGIRPEDAEKNRA